MLMGRGIKQGNGLAIARDRIIRASYWSKVSSKKKGS